jgi:DNA-binding beta-propeller fold protein YncE
MRARKRLLTFAVPLAIMTGGCWAALADDSGRGDDRDRPKGDEQLVLKKTIGVGVDSNGKPLKLTAFDISFVDPKIELYVLADRTNASVDLFDSEEGEFIRRIGAQCSTPPTTDFCFQGVQATTSVSGPDGVVIVDQKEIWAGDGDSKIKVLDIKTGKFITTISTGDAQTDKRVDEMAYDPRDHRLAAANNAADPPFVTVFDTQNKSVVAKLVFKTGSPNADVDATNGIEQPQWSPETGLFYISVPNVGPTANNVGGVSVIDPKTNTVTGTFLVQDCLPNGLALGPHHEALLGCGTTINGKTESVIIDITDGTVVARVGIGGSDEVWYDKGTNHYFLGADNNLTAGKNVPRLGSIDATTHKLDPSPVSSRTSHSVAADKNSHLVFLPVATPAAATPDPTNPCPDTGCIQVYRAHSEHADVEASRD